MGKVKVLKWVKQIAEPQYYWTEKTGWTQKDMPDEYWKIEEIGEIEEND
jgi:hypothetical protein